MRYTCTTVRKKTRENVREYLDEAIYGANDGIITTFAVISAGAGATLGNEAIIIIGVANLTADGFSMGASSFLSIKTEEDAHHSLIPLRILRKRQGNALPRSAVTFGAFVIAGSMPLLPFIIQFSKEHMFLISAIASGISFFIVGGIRTVVTKKGFVFSGIEMLLVGGIAAGIAYTIGAVVQSVV